MYLLNCFIVLYLTMGVAARVAAGTFRAGAAAVDATLPPHTGPLAGYDYGPRVVSSYPIPNFKNYTTWMEPNQGSWEPLYASALILDDGQGGSFCFVTMDAIGADGTLANLAFNMARAQGFSACKSADQVMLSASHSHSGPGAISPEFLWSIVPATDLMVPELQKLMAGHIAEALINAEKAMEPALIDVGVSQLPNVTHNRRSGISPYVHSWTVDTNLLVIRVDSVATKKPISVLWNFAIHGICYDAPNMKYSSDVMGAVNRWLATNIGGVPLFINGDAGDVNPIFSVCCKNAPNFSGGAVIGAAVKKNWAQLKPDNQGIRVRSHAEIVPFGRTNLNLTLQRIDNCTTGGQLDICRICKVLDCDANLHLDESWVEENPRFSAVRLDLGGAKQRSILVSSVPGEPLTELGEQLRADAAKAGFDRMLIAGYSNSHLGYIATANEYEIGGYEGLLTFFGIGEAQFVRETVRRMYNSLI